jgi:lipoprotein NlpD
MQQRFAALLAAAGAVLIAACGTQRPAPVVDRSGAPAARTEAPAAPAVPRPVAEGTYTVQRGDTLYSIAMRHGLDVRELARWNGISDSSVLSVGQTLRLTAPPAVATVTPVAPAGSTEVRPLPAPGAAAATPTPSPSSTPPAPATTPPPAAPVPPTAAAGTPPIAAVPPKPDTAKPAPVESALNWQWPAPGKVIEGFDETRNKGIDIAGNDGDPVLAAADGEVVYVGAALRGYGNLVIVKHSDEFISAYAHNRQVLVKQGQAVKRGQRIAEFGRSDADRIKLHFEIRRQGKPVDPLKYLPAR